MKNDRIPDWLNIAFGYSANGMYGEFENKSTWRGVALPETERYRQFYCRQILIGQNPY